MHRLIFLSITPPLFLDARLRGHDIHLLRFTCDFFEVRLKSAGCYTSVIRLAIFISGLRNSDDQWNMRAHFFRMIVIPTFAGMTEQIWIPAFTGMTTAVYFNEK